MEESGTVSIGFLQMGMSFARSAKFLDDGLSTRDLKVSHSNPVDYLYAHAIELMLKGCHLGHDPSVDVESFRHDLLRLYDEAKSSKILGGLIESVEKAVKDRWKLHLRDARDKYSADLALGEVSIDEAEDMGIFENDVIGRELPELRRQVVWLSERHKDEGGRFRYLSPGVDSREQIRAFGLSDDVVRRSSHWACEEIYDRFREFRLWDQQ